jgi:hypothetical protein
MYNFIFGILFLFLVCSPVSAEGISSRSTSVDLASLNSFEKENLTNILSSKLFIPTGTTTFSILFWDLYKSTLYSTSGKYPLSSKSESLIFHINYLTNISSEDLIVRTIEQWQHLDIEEKRYSHYVTELKKIWPNITDGDSLALLIQNNKSYFYFNDLYIGTIDDPYFGQLFIDIWLSKSTSQPTLRAELLGDSYYE